MKFMDKWNEAKIRNQEFAELQAEKILLDTKWNWTRRSSTRRVLILVGLLWPFVILLTHIYQPNNVEVNVWQDLIPWSLISVLVGVLVIFLLRVSVRTIADLPDDYLDERMLRIRNESYVWSYRFLAELFAIGFTIPLVWMIATSQDPAHMTITFSDYDLLGVMFFALAFGISLPSIGLLLKNSKL